MFKRFVSLFLCALFVFAPGIYVEASGGSYVKIGLYYGSNAMIAANLQNAVGAGYRFGYLDATGSFISVAQTEETKITMVKNRTVYLSGSTYYDNDPGGGSVLGCYHENINSDAGSYENASAIAGEKRAAGIPAFVFFSNGKWGVRAGNYSSSDNGTYVTGSKYAISVVKTGTSDIIFQFDGNSDSMPLVIMPDTTGTAAPQTWFKGYKYCGAFIYNRTEGNNISVLNYLSMDDYIKGVIPYEMSPSWPLEALKAQAVCASSYAMTKIGRHKSAGFDLCTEDHCQVYRGMNNASETTNRAVDETAGQYLRHNGEICETYYHSSNGGATENSENVWSASLPYLRGVYDSNEDLSKAMNGTWTYTYNNDTLTQLLRNKGYTTSGVTNFYISRFTPTGNVLSVVLEDSSGKKFTFSKEGARTFFNDSSLGIYTHSQRYTINSGEVSLSVIGSNGSRSLNGTEGIYAVGENGETGLLPQGSGVKVIQKDGQIADIGSSSSSSSSGVYVVSGRGWGHNVGMSQWGARGMAESGYDYKYILNFYFTGTQIG